MVGTVGTRYFLENGWEWGRYSLAPGAARGVEEGGEVCAFVLAAAPACTHPAIQLHYS